MKRDTGHPRPRLSDLQKYPKTFYCRVKRPIDIDQGRQGLVPRHAHFRKAQLCRWTFFPCSVIYAWNSDFMRRSGVSVLYPAWLRIKRAYGPRTKHIDMGAAQ